MITGQQAAQMSPMQRNNVLQQVEAILKKDRNNLDALLSGAALHHANKHTEKNKGVKNFMYFSSFI